MEKDSVTPPCKYVNIPDSKRRHAAVLERSGCEYVETSLHAPITDRHTIWLAEECQGKIIITVCMGGGVVGGGEGEWGVGIRVYDAWISSS